MKKNVATADAMEWVDIKLLIPWKDNPRKNDASVEKVAASIKRFGFSAPIVARLEDKQIIAGHTRWKAAQKLGLGKVPVRFMDLDPADARLLALADNRLGEFSEWDDSSLLKMLGELRQQDSDAALIAGWSDSDIDVMLKEAGDAVLGDIVEDEVPEPPIDAITKRGDLWLLGEHRLLCGDSASAIAVDALMGSDKACLMATDPPYGVAYGDETGSDNIKYPTIANDENNGPKLQCFLESVFSVAAQHLIDNAAWYLWHAQMTQGFFAAAAAAAGLLIHRQIIWVKPSLVLGHGDYHWRHELCFYGWRTGHRARWFGDRCQTTIWEVGRENDRIHPTQKPVELFARPIQLNTLPCEVVYEPFAGSGSQYIAAEQLGRKCYGLEIEPRYCDVIVARWENLTGKKAQLEGGIEAAAANA